MFCYPNGGRGDFNDMTRRLLLETGYTCALTTEIGLNDARSDVFELKRYGADNRADWYQFVARVSGLFDYLFRLKEGIPSLLRRRQVSVSLARRFSND